MTLFTKYAAVAILVVALSAVSFGLGNNYGRDAERADVYHGESAIDEVIDIGSDWFRGGNRFVLLDLRREAMKVLAGKDVFVLNAMISEDPIYSSCVINPLYPDSEGGMISGNVVSNLDATSFRYREGVTP